jgi:uncharacterized protein (TIGR02246 family)
MTINEQRIQVLADKDEIRELTARYCYAVVRKDANALLDMFTTDGEFHMDGLSCRGQDELKKLYVDKVGEVAPVPFIQNHVIQVDGDRATGNCAVEIRLVQDGKAYTACGYYDDQYRRVNGAWKFANRKFNLFHWVPLSEGWGKK